MNTPTGLHPLELVEDMRKSIHAFNNTLTPILANAQLARAMIDPSDRDIREAVDDIVHSAERARKLVQEMRETAKALQASVDGRTRG